jgi:hypothetical protein
MVVTDMLRNAFCWTFQQFQHYYSKEQLKIAYHLLPPSIGLAKQTRQAAMIKTLQPAFQWQPQRCRLAGLATTRTPVIFISFPDLPVNAGAPTLPNSSINRIAIGSATGLCFPQWNKHLYVGF